MLTAAAVLTVNKDSQMLRFMRLDIEALAPQTVDAMTGTASLLDSLNISSNARSLIASVDADGSKFNFTTAFSGNVTGVFLVDGVPQFEDGHKNAAARYEAATAEIRSALESAYPSPRAGAIPDSSHTLSAPEFLCLLLQYPQHLVVVDDSYPVIVPAMESGYYAAMLDAAHTAADAAAAAAAAAVAPPPPPPAAAPAAVPPPPPPPGAPAAGAAAGGAAAGGLSGCLIALLIGLLLLLLALGIYFWRFWPWPFEDLVNSQVDELTMLEEQLVRDESALAMVNELLEQSESLISLSEENSRLNDLDAQLAKLEQELQIREDLEQLLLQTDAFLKEEQQPAVQAAAEAGATTDKTVTANGKKLPKCETIIKEGKVPQLLIATDGSGSMIKPLNDGTMRITAAIKAAHALVDSVDKNVPVRLFGMQGCPLARDYGTFGASQRSALKKAITQTNPMNVRGMLPFEVLTPLISGLTGMVNAAPAGVESVGILISDGVDTCKNTENMDICAVARKLHKSKPLLKIHVILIGEDAPDAKCVADITGGKVYRPGDAIKLVSNLKSAGKALEKVCN